MTGLRRLPRFRLKRRENCKVDRDIHKYLEARAKPPLPEVAADEERLVGQCVARRKSDAKVVAFADDFDALEEVMEESKIDPESVVLAAIENPASDFIF